MSKEQSVAAWIVAIALVLFVVAVVVLLGGGKEQTPPELAAVPTPTSSPAVSNPERPASQPETQPVPAQPAEHPRTPQAPLKGPRVVILGFDGVEPSLVDAMFAKGELPNLDAIRKKGTYSRLGTTVPPLSPVAWASFATCKGPGTHGVFDFMGRNPATYAVKSGEGHLEFPKLGPDGAVIGPARYVTRRHGDSFWLDADRQGRRCKVLYVPFAYPADPLTHGIMLCGEGVPDIRGSSSTSFWMSDAFTDEQLREEVFGGIRLRLQFEGDSATVRLPVAKDPRPGRPGLLVATKLTVDRVKHSITTEFQSGPVTVQQGQWSNWIEWKFPITPKFDIRAISRLYVIEAGERVRLYMSCMQFHPREPLAPISAPNAYSAQLVDRYGLYKTIGWSHDTHALRKDALPEDVFLAEALDEMDWKERLALDELEMDDFHMLIACWTAPDRIAHTFWRFRDPKHPLYTAEGAVKYGTAVEDSYRRMDEIVGKIAAKLRPDDLLMVLSDHGFHSFRTGFNVTTWLVRNGYLAVKGQTDPATATKESQEFLDGYDWTRTKAYAVGLGGIYVNLQGREAQGTVNPADAPALLQEIKEKLLQVTHPETGERVLTSIYLGSELQGPNAADAPDLQLGYAEGFQTSKPAAKGAAPAGIFSPNDDKWSGDHAASSANETKGIFFANKPLATADPSILDLGPTALALLGAEIPADYQGHSLLP